MQSSFYCEFEPEVEQWSPHSDLGPAYLTPCDYPRLAVLGVTTFGSADIGDIVAGVRSLSQGDWSPTEEVIEAAVSALCGEASLYAAFEPARFSLTTAGRSRFNDLMVRPLVSGFGNEGKVGASLKICFLGSLDLARRQSVLSDLKAGCMRELQGLRSKFAGGPGQSRYAAPWLDRECERLENEIDWLGRIGAVADV